MSRPTLLDLLGTEQLPLQAEQRFIDFCIWEQGRPALARVLEAAGLSEHAAQVTAVDNLEALTACVAEAAAAAAGASLPMMALAAVQGVAAEIEQMAAVADAKDGDSGAVSFHAARIAGWAGWAANNFGQGMFKSSAEEIAYGEQLQELMRLLGAQHS